MAWERDDCSCTPFRAVVLSQHDRSIVARTFVQQQSIVIQQPAHEDAIMGTKGTTASVGERGVRHH
jgi:hypothetical protein